MRIMSLKIRPAARIFAIIYAAASPISMLFMLLSKVDYVRVPLGLVAPPLIYLNINFDIQHPTHFFSGVLLGLFAILCYAITGWLTGAAAVLGFNFLARRMGGIEASVLTSELRSAGPTA
jgi:hypothetical protein